MKLSLKNYDKPTPKFWRRLGDSLLAVSTFAATWAGVNENTTLSIIFLLLGVLGKFLTNFNSI